MPLTALYALRCDSKKINVQMVCLAESTLAIWIHKDTQKEKGAKGTYGPSRRKLGTQPLKTQRMPSVL